MNNVFQTILRNQYPALSAVVRRFHESRLGSFDGLVDVTGAPGWFASWLRRQFGLPQPGTNMKTNVKVIRTEVEERWLRQWGDAQFSSKLRRVTKGNMLSEDLGTLKFFFDLALDGESLRWRLLDWSFAGIPMPQWLGPEIEAFESADDKGSYRFSVKVSYPGIGELVSYSGSLNIPQASAS